MRGGSGCFLVLEGGEGVGKTTQWRRLHDALRAAGHDVVALREPGGTAAGDVMRELVLDPRRTLAAPAEALLFAASRAQLIDEVVSPALARGAVVLVDRFLLSTYAYQGAGRGLPLETLRLVNRFATQGLVPDLTVLLTLSLDDALGRMTARGSADRMERETREFHERVGHAFMDAATPAWQSQHPEIGPVVQVDATGSEAAVTARVLDAIAGALPSRFARTPVAAEPTHG